MTGTRRVRLRSIVVVAALSLSSSLGRVPTAHAQQQDPKKTEAAKPDAKGDAARLKKDADALMDQDKYAEALALYARAFDLTGDPALLYNQGRALEAMGDYPEAIDKLEQFERDAPAALQKKVTGLHEHLVDLRNRVTTIVVTTNVPGARLFLREKGAGTIDREARVRTRSGPAAIEIVADGYEPFHTSVELPGGSTVNVDAQLVPKRRAPEDALIVVRTRPAADVSLGDRALGRTPLSASVPPGSYTLVARAEGHHDERVAMTLAVGDRREVDLDLRKTAPVTSRWWFWTGIGVIVAGSVASYVLLTTERDPDQGTFRPGSVAGP
jgi:tetratricopeptide (TPR) repeat protein